MSHPALQLNRFAINRAVDHSPSLDCCGFPFYSLVEGSVLTQTSGAVISATLAQPIRLQDQN